jgi:anthranilate synthase/aminodeoxychorismate synthase-like glutamine amidotransferase
VLLLIDNYDSFTYNLVQALGRLGGRAEVARNDAITLREARRRAPTRLIVSPGPGEPKGAGVSTKLIRSFAGRIPILGVCLGHQCLAAAFGGRVRRAAQPMHGKTSRVRHDGRTIFAGLPQPFEAMRYHSLVVDEERLPADLEATARTDEGELMGIRHRRWPVEGVQFHPESYRTEAGLALLENFLSL